MQRQGHRGDRVADTIAGGVCVCVSCEGGCRGGRADWIVILSMYRGGLEGVGGGLNDVNNTTQKVNSHS